MTRTKLVAAVATPFLLGGAVVGVVAAANAATGEGSDEERGTASGWIATLEQNRADLQEQQEAESREARAALALPPGTDWGPAETFPELTQQISALDSAVGDGPEAVAELLTQDPHTLWYEDGFFASLAAIDWRCAWLSTGVAAVQNGDEAGAREAVSQLQGFADSELADAFPDYDIFLTQYAAPLLDGTVDGALGALAACAPQTLAGGLDA